MKYIFSIILAITVTHSVFSQICRDDIRRLGELAEPKRFEYVGYSKDAYYEITHEENAAFLICGEPVSIPVGSVVNLTGSLYKGSYNRITGTWCETYINLSGDNVTRVYFLISDLKKLPGRPEKEIFSEVVGEKILVEKGAKQLIFLFIGIVFITLIVIYWKLLFPPPPRSYSPSGGSNYSGGSNTGYSPNISQSSTTTTSSPNSNKDPNEGYHVTGYDAYGPSERRDNFGLTTQRKNDFGHWENV